MDHDYSTNGSGTQLSEVSDEVREIVSRSTDNRGEIELAPQHILNGVEQFGRMETVPVTIEEPWSEATEMLLRNWKDHAQKAADSHEEAGQRTKSKHKLIGFVVVLSSTLNFIFNSLFPCSDEPVYQILLVFSAGINVFWNAIVTQLNLQERYRLHFEYQIKYQDLVYDITYTLSRDLDFRPAADQFLTEVKERKKLLDTAPEFPNSRYFFW